MVKLKTYFSIANRHKILIQKAKKFTQKCNILTQKEFKHKKQLNTRYVFKMSISVFKFTKHRLSV
jgi:uncharacterized Rmd1/YagE family protein